MFTISPFYLLMVWTGLQASQVVAATLVLRNRTLPLRRPLAQTVLTIAVTLVPLFALLAIWTEVAGSPWFAYRVFAGRRWLHLLYLAIGTIETLFAILNSSEERWSLYWFYWLTAGTTAIAALVVTVLFAYR